MTDTHPILSRIEAHLEATGETPTAFGKAALKDPNLVFELRAGRDLRRGTVKIIVDHLERQETTQEVAS